MDYSAMSIAELTFEGLKVAAPLFSLLGVFMVWWDQKNHQHAQKEKDFEFGRELAELNKQISVEVKLSEFEMKHLEQVTLSRVKGYTQFLNVVASAHDIVSRAQPFNENALGQVCKTIKTGQSMPIYTSDSVSIAWSDLCTRIYRTQTEANQYSTENWKNLRESLFGLFFQLQILIEKEIIDAHDFSGIRNSLNERLDECCASLLKRGVKPLKTEIEKQDASSRETTRTSDKKESSSEES